jgi:hypothetical protein
MVMPDTEEKLSEKQQFTASDAIRGGRSAERAGAAGSDSPETGVPESVWPSERDH